MTSLVVADDTMAASPRSISPRSSAVGVALVAQLWCSRKHPRAVLANELSERHLGDRRCPVARGVLRSARGELQAGVWSPSEPQTRQANPNRPATNDAKRVAPARRDAALGPLAAGKLQAEITNRIVALIEQLTGRKVLAFPSQAHVKPDLTIEMFLMDAPLAGFGALELVDPGDS